MIKLKKLLTKNKNSIKKIQLNKKRKVKKDNILTKKNICILKQNCFNNY